MARQIVSMTTLSPTATADGAVNLVDSTYPCVIQGGSATQVVNIWEISIIGQAPSSSSPTFFILSYDGTQVGTGSNTYLSGQVDSAMNPATAALAAPVKTGNQWATNKPQRSLAGHLGNFSVNAFGGVAFWRANRAEEVFQVLGNAVTTGEISLSAFTGGTPGLCGSHVIYEPLQSTLL